MRSPLCALFLSRAVQHRHRNRHVRRIQLMASTRAADVATAENAPTESFVPSTPLSTTIGKEEPEEVAVGVAVADGVAEALAE